MLDKSTVYINVCLKDVVSIIIPLNIRISFLISDLELDADGHQNFMGGAPQAVRKTISLNLTKKTKQRTKSSTAKSKAKRDRRDRDGDGKDTYIMCMLLPAACVFVYRSVCLLTKQQK